MRRYDPYYIPPWFVFTVVLALALWIGLLAIAYGQTPPCNPPCVKIDQTTNPPKIVTGTQDVFLTFNPAKLHIRPHNPMARDARGGPLNEQLYHNEREELLHQVNPMNPLNLMPRSEALKEGTLGIDGKGHVDAQGNLCPNAMCRSWPSKR